MRASSFQAEMKPIYTPRTTFNKHKEEINRLSTNLAINIDKYILGFFKDTFQAHQDRVTLHAFISEGQKHLKSWQRELPDRQIKILLCLKKLFEETDFQRKGIITWAKFNSMLIEKGLSLKSLKNEEPGSTSLLKLVPIQEYNGKHSSPIAKMVCLPGKIAVFCQQSNQIDFYPTEQNNRQHPKPIIFSHQELIVQTLIPRRHKQLDGTGVNKMHKKDVVVANYKTVILNMIYIDDSKYRMLITSSSDCTVRGWDASSNTPTLAKQPENEDEKMFHQFTVPMHCLSWDSSNEVLYCSSDDQRIFQWVIKTDSEKEISDPEGHETMIAAMLIMPKLQFLATGDFDGKLILWETISQTKKFKYLGHTRSITSMAFHERLILLFTAACDHNICVWNPYIPSIVHKIVGILTVIQLDVIPNTDLLLALDADGSVKLREISKFTLVSSFSVNQHEHNIEPTCIARSEKPLRYYFGGLSMLAFEYINLEANISNDFNALCLKSASDQFLLYQPIKNAIIVWNLLTGGTANTFRQQSESQITGFDILHQMGLFVIGDAEGNLSLRKLQNGALMKKLLRQKAAVTMILAVQLSLQQSLIFSGSSDGQISMYSKNASGDFVLVRTISLRKLNPLASLKLIDYQKGRNTLIIVTNQGDIYFLDIEKNKIISAYQTISKDIRAVIQLLDIPVLLCFCADASIEGIYLPPHSDKFKQSSHLVSKEKLKISGAVMSKINNRCYFTTENGEIVCFSLNQHLLTTKGAEPKIMKFTWKIACPDTVRNCILIENEEVLAAIVGSRTILLITCETGKTIAELSHRTQIVPPQPILHFKEETECIYIKQIDEFVPISLGTQEAQLRKIMDPSFFIKIAQNFISLLDLQTNSTWKYSPNISNQADVSVAELMNLKKQLDQYERRPKKLEVVKTEATRSTKIVNAIEIQKKWERQKQEEQQKVAQSAFKKTWLKLTKDRFSSLHNLNRKVSDSNAVDQSHPENINRSSPLYRLGAALMSINNQDGKARLLMDMAGKARNSSAVKFPRV